MNRAIDRHEDQIVEVMDLIDNGWHPNLAVQSVATRNGLTAERLTGLVKVWCAVGGFADPFEGVEG